MDSAGRYRRSALRLMLGLASVVLLLLVTGVALAATFGITSTTLTTSAGATSVAPTTCTLGAADADSYVDETNLISNFGGATNLDISTFLLGNRRTFVQLNLGSCSIPANSLIMTASLKLFMFAAPTQSRTYDLHRVTGAWTETGVTWSNQPAVAASATSNVATGTTSNVTLTWSVTADVQAFVDGTTNRGWRFKDQTESSATTRTGQFRSAEYGTASQRPVLEVTYYP